MKPTMVVLQPLSRKSIFSIFALCIVFSLLSPSGLSESNSSSSSVIRLPTAVDDDGGDDASIPCAGSADSVACPVKCFRTDPVCGVDGVTYWCGCTEAFCAGTQVAKLGFCEVRNGGSPGQALLLVHIVWLILLGFFVLFGLF